MFGSASKTVQTFCVKLPHLMLCTIGKMQVEGQYRVHYKCVNDSSL